jgi:hypothetical protein
MARDDPFNRMRALIISMSGRAEKFFASTPVSTALPLLSIGIAFAFAFWKDEILNTLFRFAWPSDPNFSQPATQFWVLMMLLFVLTAGNIWAKNRDSRRTTVEVKGILAEMGSESVKLTYAVTRLHSLPPVGVLEECFSAYDMCNRYYQHGMKLTDASGNMKVELEETMRGMLFVIEKFIRIFDGEHLASSGVRYGLNIMIFVKKSEYEIKPLRGQLQSRLKFGTSTITLDTAFGALDILPKISVESGRREGDSELVHFALPIEEEPRFAKNAEVGRPALAGATDCCINITHTSVPSIEFMKQRMDELKVDEGRKQQISEYFSDDQILKTVRSFLCVPLAIENDAIVGVLNIHRNMANPTLNDKMGLLVPLVTPFRHQLTQLLLKYKALYLVAH